MINYRHLFFTGLLGFGLFFPELSPGTLPDQEKTQCPNTVEEVQAYRDSLSASFANQDYEDVIEKIVSDEGNNPEKDQYELCMPKITKGKTEASPSCMLRLKGFVDEVRKMKALKFVPSPSLKIPKEFTNSQFLEKVRKFPPDLSGVFATIAEMNSDRPEKEKVIATYFKSQNLGIESFDAGRVMIIVPGNPAKALVLSVPEHASENSSAKDSGAEITDIGVIALHFDPNKYAKGQKFVTSLKWNDTVFQRNRPPRGLHDTGDKINCNKCHQGKLLPIMTGFSQETFGDGKVSLNEWIQSLEYKKIVDTEKLGPSIGADRERSLAEVAACEASNEWELGKATEPSRGQRSLQLVADAMRCSSCHGKGKETIALKLKEYSNPEFDKFRTMSIDQGWMPSPAKIPLNDYEKRLLKACLHDEFFGLLDQPGTFTKWFRKVPCTNVTPGVSKDPIKKLNRKKEP